MSFLVLILLFWLVWTIGTSQMGPGKLLDSFLFIFIFINRNHLVGDPEEANSESPNHFDLPDLYNKTFSPKRPSLVWVKNGKLNQ